MELRSRRRAAIERQLARGYQEILDDRLAEVTPVTLQQCITECLANLALAGFQ